MVDQYLQKYFKLAHDVIHHHKSIIEKYKLTKPQINYLELKPFLDNAANFLYELDHQIADELTTKLYKDIQSLFEFKKEIQNKTKSASFIFYNDYLPSLREYVETKQELELAKQVKSKNESLMKETENQLKILELEPKKDEKVYKALKKKNVDAIYNYSVAKEKEEKLSKKLVEIEKREEAEFIPKFKKISEEIIKALDEILNVKLYYFDKLLWHRANESDRIKQFFEISNIKGEINSKTFIHYQIKNIDISKSSKSSFLAYLKKVLRML